MNTVPGGDSNQTQIGPPMTSASAQTMSLGPADLPPPAIKGDDAALAKALATLPNYVIEKKLGEGGMGAVYRAHQKNLQRTVAIKVLPQRLCSNAMYVARLNREAIVLAKITHPNVIGCYDLGEHEGMRYVVMEFVEGETLGSLIEKRKALQLTEALYYLKQAVVGLDCANAQGIIHRDIKPENLLLDKVRVGSTTMRLPAGHQLKIADLGLATFTSEETENTRLTAEGSTLGTPNYMSPEQTIGESDLDFRTDQYALGITMYHMVTGVLPFTANTVGAVLAKKMSETVPDPRSHRPELPPALSLLLQKMTARKKEDRYASYGELLQDIENIERSRPLCVSPLPLEKASVALQADTLATLKKAGVSVSTLGTGSSDAEVKLASKGPLIGIGVAAGIVIVVAALFMSKKPDVAQPKDGAKIPEVVTKIENVKPPEVVKQPDIASTTPDKPKHETFGTQLLIEDRSTKGWQYAGDAKDFMFQDGNLNLINLKGRNGAQRMLPSSEYVLRATMMTPTGADECEVRVGLDEKSYVACGIRLPADAKRVTAYVERREVNTDKLIEQLAKTEELSVDEWQNFRLQVSDGSVSCFLNNSFMRAVTLSEIAAKSKLLRLGVSNGIAQFSILEISPVTK
jgi:serine/threonine protein kinase